MVFIAGSEILETEPLKKELVKIYGIGNKRSIIICKKLGLSQNVRIQDLNDNQVLKLLKYFEKLSFLLSDDLKIYRQNVLNNLITKKSYKGYRRVFGLPSRGQRTHTNSKTCRKFKNKA